MFDVKKIFKSIYKFNIKTDFLQGLESIFTKFEFFRFLRNRIQLINFRKITLIRNFSYIFYLTRKKNSLSNLKFSFEIKF